MKLQVGDVIAFKENLSWTCNVIDMKQIDSLVKYEIQAFIARNDGSIELGPTIIGTADDLESEFCLVRSMAKKCTCDIRDLMMNGCRCGGA